MNIVIALNSYYRLTGSELYVYELSRVLAARGHKVTILANQIGGDLAKHTKENGVAMYEFFGHPELKPDIVHVQQPNPTAYCLRFFPTTPHITTIHSELSYEQPITSGQIKKYIFVRPEIQALYPDLDGEVILNGVDRARFNKLKTGDENPNAILFVGTIDPLRAKTVEHLKLYAKREKKELVLVSPDIQNMSIDSDNHIRYCPARFDIEGWTKYCGETAGILMGRTTIEGWMCGKPGIIYDIDTEGNILNCRKYAVPQPYKLIRFDIEYMTDKVLEVYKEALHG